MLARVTLALFCACLLALAYPAAADPPASQVSIDSGRLVGGLQDLQRQTGIELLYDGDLVRSAQSPAVRGSFTTEEALRRLLAGTDLTIRRAESGVWIIERPDTPVLAQQDAAVTQILVIGTRTQNADIRRTENDVQPYIVSTKAEIINAHRDSVDQFLNSRVTSNTQIGDPFNLTSADTFSEIDLRGLGTDNTLVLIDGRRMPAILDPTAGFGQADLNPIPLHAIKRIETLTGTAGGIHGFGALGGVVNVVIDRDSRGFDLHLTQGISSRGDAHRQSIEAGFGYTTDDDATDFSAFASISEFDTLLAGQRDFLSRDRREIFKADPEYYLSFYHGNSLTVRNIGGSNLVFKPEFGGAELPSTYTFLPVGFSGTASDLTTSLTNNAGQVDFSVGKGDAQTDLGSRPQSSALFVNLRHTFGADLEAYADAVVMRSRGESHERGAFHMRGYAFMSPDSPVNPFTSYVSATFPLEGYDAGATKHFETARYTAGLVAELPLDWRGAAEMGVGSSRFTAEVSNEYDLTGTFLLLFGDPSDLDTNPFSDWSAFQRSIAVDPSRFTIRNSYRTEFDHQSLRLAGSVFETAAGPATLTLLAERREEHLPAYEYTWADLSGGVTRTGSSPVSAQTSGTTSLSAELKSRVFDENAPAWFLRELELQFAARRDDQDFDFRNGPGPELGRVNFAGTAYTAGAKISPASWLMLRGSYATGKQPLNLFLMRIVDDEMTTEDNGPDPKRGDTPLGMDGEYLWRQSDPSDLELIQANTTYLGVVLTPFGVDGPSLAIDYSRIRKKNEVVSLSPLTVMAHEDFWPERVVRAPLTDGDRTNGYTAGRVIMLDSHEINGVGRKVDAYDMRAEWPLAFLGGRLRLYADATYHKRNVRSELFQPDQQQAGYRLKPLKWRANGGFDWSIEDLTVGANLQYFGSYLIHEPDFAYIDHIKLQGSDRVSSQTFVDLYATWRLPFRNAGPVREATLEFGMVNVFDEAPARETAQPFTGGPGYSLYGDPRQRRFEVTLSSHF